MAVVKEAGLRSDGELVQAVSEKPEEGADRFVFVATARGERPPVIAAEPPVSPPQPQDPYQVVPEGPGDLAGGFEGDGGGWDFGL
ncbi:MAG: hypothetical protein R3D85_17040 [Paracoccaceae bacterium]